MAPARLVAVLPELDTGLDVGELEVVGPPELAAAEELAGAGELVDGIDERALVSGSVVGGVAAVPPTLAQELTATVRAASMTAARP